MPNKFEVMKEGILEYKSRMEMAIQEWDQAGRGQICSEELANAHSLLKKEILDGANEAMAKCWWTERMRWRNFRKLFERDIERQFEHFREFISLREELREEREKHAKILEMGNKLMGEMGNCGGNEAAELNEKIRINRREEEELAKKMDILARKYQIKMANKMDDYKTAHSLEKGGHMAGHLSRLFPAAGLVGASVLLVGTLADFVRRSNKRNKEVRKLDEQIGQGNDGRIEMKK